MHFIIISSCVDGGLSGIYEQVGSIARRRSSPRVAAKEMIGASFNQLNGNALSLRRATEYDCKSRMDWLRRMARESFIAI